MPGLDDLVGSSYGPFTVEVTQERAAAFSAVVGVDPTALSGRAHPMLANAALFAVAPALLADTRLDPFTRSLIHSEQSFRWHAPLSVGDRVEVTGTVAGVRARGTINLVSFGVEATTARGPWMTGSSVFLMSAEAVTAGADEGEPPLDDRPVVDGPLSLLPWPAGGDLVPEVACGASRSDLVRYAEVSGDHNPIHLEHEAARAAGLEGVIVHGLLMAAWIGRVAGRYGSLDSMRLRFRNPLRPAVPARVTGSVAAADEFTAELDLTLSTDAARLVTARVAVTR